MNTGSKLRSINSLIRQEPSVAEMFEVLDNDVVSRMDDRSLAILESAYVEQELEEFLTSRLVTLKKEEFRGLFEGGGPLSSFSAKTKIAYAFGCIGRNTRNELDRIRTIRNVFAHSRLPLRFDTGELKAECERLMTPKRMGPPPPALRKKMSWPLRAPRDLFYCTTSALQIMFIFGRNANAGRASPISKRYPPLD